MQHILQQYVFISYSPFLALPAPEIAGLLPARVVPPTTFTYATVDFGHIPDVARATLIEMATRLLDAVTRYLNGAPDEGQLFQAEHDFHETLVAVHLQPAPRRVSQFADKPGAAKAKLTVPTKEEMDAEIDAFIAESRARIREAQERTRRKLAAWREGERSLSHDQKTQ